MRLWAQTWSSVLILMIQDHCRATSHRSLQLRELEFVHWNLWQLCESSVGEIGAFLCTVLQVCFVFVYSVVNLLTIHFFYSTMTSFSSRTQWLLSMNESRLRPDCDTLLGEGEWIWHALACQWLTFFPSAWVYDERCIHVLWWMNDIAKVRLWLPEMFYNKFGDTNDIPIYYCWLACDFTNQSVWRFDRPPRSLTVTVWIHCRELLQFVPLYISLSL